MSIFEIEKAVATFSATTFLQIFEESVVSCVARSDNFNVNLLLVFNVKDYISMLFVFFNLLVRRLTNVGYCYSGCLNKQNRSTPLLFKFVISITYSPKQHSYTRGDTRYLIRYRFCTDRRIEDF